MNASAWAAPSLARWWHPAQQHLGDLGLFLDHATIFVELIHEPALGLEAAARADQHDVDALRCARAPRSERGWVTPDPVLLLGRWMAGCRRALRLVASCSTAAARKVSAAPTIIAGRKPPRNFANLPMVVVLPTPLTLTTSTNMDGRWSVRVGLSRARRSSRVSQHPLEVHRVGRAESLDARTQPLQ
jgi:hypothetical protein